MSFGSRDGLERKAVGDPYTQESARKIEDKIPNPGILFLPLVGWKRRQWEGFFDPPVPLSIRAGRKAAWRWCRCIGSNQVGLGR